MKQQRGIVQICRRGVQSEEAPTLAYFSSFLVFSIHVLSTGAPVRISLL